MAWRLVDCSTGVIDRSTDTVTRPCDSWLVNTESELLAILERTEFHKGYDLRVMVLESDELSVTFGVGGYFSFVEGSRKYPPYESKRYLRPFPEEECISGHDTGFGLWHDDLLEFLGEQLITWAQALDILLWIFRHEQLPEWDEEVGCRFLHRDPPGSPDEVPF